MCWITVVLTKADRQVMFNFVVLKASRAEEDLGEVHSPKPTVF